METLNKKKLRELVNLDNPGAGTIIHAYDPDTGKDHKLLLANINRPGSFPAWEANANNGAGYAVDERVEYGLKLWKSLVNGNLTVPTAGVNWTEVSAGEVPNIGVFLKTAQNISIGLNGLVNESGIFYCDGDEADRPAGAVNGYLFVIVFSNNLVKQIYFEFSSHRVFQRYKNTSWSAWVDLRNGCPIDCGNYDASVGSLPSTGGTGNAGAIQRYNEFFFSVGGVIDGNYYPAGTIARALVNNPSTFSDWKLY